MKKRCCLVNCSTVNEEGVAYIHALDQPLSDMTHGFHTFRSTPKVPINYQ